MLFYMWAMFLSMTVFGVTSATLQLQVLQGLSEDAFIFGGIMNCLIGYIINQGVQKDRIKEMLWNKRIEILTLDVIVFIVVTIVTPLSFELRYLGIATVVVMTNYLMSSVWEHVKERTGNGVMLNANRESKSMLGYLVGSSAFLLLKQFDILIELNAALLLQALAVLVEGVAFYYVIRKL